jgi:hypothetical protein
MRTYWLFDFELPLLRPPANAALAEATMATTAKAMKALRIIGTFLRRNIHVITIVLGSARPTAGRPAMLVGQVAPAGCIDVALS